ncbi:hypothetical protein AE23_05160, partial [Klebsiella pneumoniae UCI 64]
VLELYLAWTDMYVMVSSFILFFVLAK